MLGDQEHNGIGREDDSSIPLQAGDLGISATAAMACNITGRETAGPAWSAGTHRMGTGGGFERYCSTMPVLKYFLFIGPLLSLLLFGWSAYLAPSEGPIEAVAKAANTPKAPTTPEAFRSTPAPPLAELDAVAPTADVAPVPEPTVADASEQPSKSAQLHHKKRKVKIVRRRETPRDDNFASAVNPFFFGWR